MDIDLKEELQGNINELTRKVYRIEDEELTQQNLFGPKTDEKKFPTMKEFIMNNLEAGRVTHEKLLQDLRKDMGI